MTLFDMSSDQILLLSAVLAKYMGECYDIDSLNVLGNFFITLGTDITLIIAIKEAQISKSEKQTTPDIPTH